MQSLSKSRSLKLNHSKKQQQKQSVKSISTLSKTKLNKKVLITKSKSKTTNSHSLFSTTSTSTDQQQEQQQPPQNIKLRPDVRTALANAVSDDMLVTLSMNFNNSGRTHQELCDNLRKNGLISTPAIEYAFRKSDRKFFDPSMHPYEDKPHDIGGGATITAAHMHAVALEALGDALVPSKTTNVEISPKTFVDVGSGSGFVTSVMAHIIHLLRLSPKHTKNAKLSRVLGIEIHPGLLEQSIENIRACFPDLVKDAHPLNPTSTESSTESSTPSSTTTTTETTSDELPIAQMLTRNAFSTTTRLPHGPFDAINCGVAIDFIPLSLLAQLKEGGRIIVPIKLANSDEQDLMLFTRKNNTLTSNGFNSEDEFFTKACEVQNSNDVTQIETFLTTHFISKAVLRCVFMMAHNEQTVPVNMPAINTAQKQRQNEALQGFFGKDSDMTPEERAQAQAQLKKQQLFEKEAKILKFQEELDEKRLQLEVTSDDIKKWHSQYVTDNQGKKPTLKEMQGDRHLNNMLIIVKELRTKIARLERAIISLQSDETNQGKKH